MLTTLWRYAGALGVQVSLTVGPPSNGTDCGSPPPCPAPLDGPPLARSKTPEKQGKTYVGTDRRRTDRGTDTRIPSDFATRMRTDPNTRVHHDPGSPVSEYGPSQVFEWRASDVPECIATRVCGCPTPPGIRVRAKRRARVHRYPGVRVPGNRRIRVRGHRGIRKPRHAGTQVPRLPSSIL